MPPRKRARQSVPSPPPKDALQPPPKPPLPPDANTGLVFKLPDETWLEIISHFCSIRNPRENHVVAEIFHFSTLERAHALRALSQTCRAFRALFLPELWEHFEVCAMPAPQPTENPKLIHCTASLVQDSDPIKQANHMYYSTAWHKPIAEALKKRSKGLMQSPDHVPYVRTASVVLTRFRAVPVLDAFVRCLETLSNLHTLQILRASGQMTTDFKLAFEAHKLPQVHTVVLPNHAHNVLRACPEARVVTCILEDGGKLIGAIAKECKNVRVLRGFTLDVNMTKRIVKGVPNLEEISLQCRNEVKVVQMLSVLERLRAIELCTDVYSRNMQHDPCLRACVAAAKKILLDNARGRDENERGKMWFRVRYHEMRHSKGVVEEIPLWVFSEVWDC
ncbi:hypothetical protein C0992_001979 [Termitomyces sp. T32_za158]|nr:hypothetical protein C0992_001979 [Termitomyces sp. T32_za158]